MRLLINRNNLSGRKERDDFSVHDAEKAALQSCALNLTNSKMNLRTQNHRGRSTRLLLLLLLILYGICVAESNEGVEHVRGGPDSVVWVVQLSDLHFSVHHPNRALDFAKLVGPALSVINPSLVLITGDLTGSPYLPSLSLPIFQVSIFKLIMFLGSQIIMLRICYKNLIRLHFRGPLIILYCPTKIIDFLQSLF